jgi:YggT family protein
VAGVVLMVFDAWFVVLFIRAVLSWIPSGTGSLWEVRRVLLAVTEPVLAPVRRVLPPLDLGGASVDLSMLVVGFVGSVLLRPLLTGALG